MNKWVLLIVMEFCVLLINNTIKIYWTIKIDLLILILLSIILYIFQNTLTSMVKARLRRGGKRQQGNGQWLGWTLQKSVCFTSFTVSVEKNHNFCRSSNFSSQLLPGPSKVYLNPNPTGLCNDNCIWIDSTQCL